MKNFNRDRADSLQSLQACRGLAAIAVLLFHTTAVFELPKYWGSNPFGSMFRPGDSGVLFFFVLSGFIIVHAHAGDIGNPAKWLIYLRKRALRIYPIYWVISAIAVLSSVFFYNKVDLIHVAPLSEIITLLPFDGGHGALAVSWTLYHEVAFYSIFSIMILNARVGAGVGIVWTIGCIAPLVFGDLNEVVRPIFDPVNLLFILGVAASVGFRKLARSQAIAALICGASLYLGVWGWLASRGHGGRGPFTDMVFGGASMMIIAGLAAVEVQRGLTVPSVFRLLGNASYSIYLTHFVALSLFVKVVYGILRHVPDALSFLVLAILALASGLASYFLIERPLLRWSRVRIFIARTSGEIVPASSPLTADP